MMSRVATLLLLQAAVGCATVRPLTYPSPCSDLYAPRRCAVVGYEVWGTNRQIHAQAKVCRRAANVAMDPVSGYGVVYCYAPKPAEEPVEPIWQAPVATTVIEAPRSVVEDARPQPPVVVVDKTAIKRKLSRERRPRRRERAYITDD